MTSQSVSVRDLYEKEFLINSSIAIKSERYHVEWKPSFFSTKNSGSTARVEGNINFLFILDKVWIQDTPLLNQNVVTFLDLIVIGLNAVFPAQIFFE